MYKYLIKIFIITLFFLNNSNSEIVKKIEVAGNKRISKETILVLGDVKINQNFTNLHSIIYQPMDMSG